jgi:putative acetyltransferase
VPSIEIESPRQEDVLSLLRQGDEFGLNLYPAESYYGLDVYELEEPGVAFFVARDGGTAVGTAALVELSGGVSEIKRMFVTDAARGLGVGRLLLEALHAHARTVGVSTIRLETGLPQVAAIALYAKAGYRHIPPFGQYVDDPTSYCMEKSL